jgi:tetratricopeptide (TPR) repeat protein
VEEFLQRANQMRTFIRLGLCAGLLMVASCGQPQDSAKDQFISLSHARGLFNLGQLKEAQSEVAAVLKSDPKSSEAHFLEGEIAERSGETQAAISEFVLADALGPGSENGRLAAARLLLRERAYRLAGEWIARCLADRPSDRPMRAYRALLELRLGESRKARFDAEAVLSENKEDSVANGVLAEEALLRKNPADALIKIAAGLSKSPTDSILLRLKAQALLQQQFSDKAIEIYQALIVAEPKNSEYRGELAGLFAQSSAPDRGERILRDGVALVPESIDMRMQLVTFLVRRGNGMLAVDELIAGIKLAPESPNYDIALANFYIQENDFDAAKAILDKALIRLQSGAAHDVVRLAVARLLFLRGDIDAASNIIDTLLKTNSANDEALALRGQIKLKNRDPAAALTDFLSIATRQPANPRVFDFLANAYLQNDQNKEAIAALKRLLSLRPSDMETVQRILDVQRSFGDLDGGRRLVDEFVSRYPDSVDGRILQTRLAIQSKDWTSVETGLARLRDMGVLEQIAVKLWAEMKEAQGLHAEAASLYKKLLVSRDSSTLDISAARSFEQTSAAAGQASQAIELLASFSDKVGEADQGAYDLIFASLYERLGRFDKADAAINSAIQKLPGSPAPYLQRALILAQRQHITDAVAFLDQGIAAGIPAELLLLSRASIQSADGRIDDAISTYRQILKLSPKSPIAANELASLLSDYRPFDQQALRDARDLLWTNAVFKTPAILDTLAWIEYRLGDFQAARKLLVKANADTSPLSELRYHYGATLIALGDRSKGKTIIGATLGEHYRGRDDAEKLLND